MFNLLLAVIYLAFISLGLPDSLLGSVWPTIYQEFNVPVSYAGAIFMIISGALSNAISRYLTYGIGVGDGERLKVIFSTSINIQICISVIILILCEVFGLWFLNSKMNIPTERLFAANWVFHFSLFTFVAYAFTSAIRD